MPYSTLIDVQQLDDLLDRPDWVLFDCRFDLADTGRGERDYQARHIPGAQYAHIDRHLSSPITPTSGRHPLPDSQALADWLGRCGVGPDTQVVVYDDSFGNMAVRLWWLLRWLGHETVALLDGGWQAWQEAGMPQSAESIEAPIRAPYPGQPNPDLVLTTSQLVSDLTAGQWLVLDARTAERFRGEQEPIDPVAGRVPGARSLPLQQNLGPNGCFLSPEQLLELYTNTLGELDPHRVACMCGSGVSACHNLLAMEIAGLKGARLYTGSWSEWIQDPARPVAHGPETETETEKSGRD